MATICPVCGKDDAVQKVSAVVSSGLSSGKFSGPTGGVTYLGGKWGGVGGYTVLSGGTASELARILSPPSRKEVVNERAAGCFRFLALATVVLGAPSCFFVGMDGGAGSLGLIALIVAVLVFLYAEHIGHQVKEAIAVEDGKIKEPLRKWQRLYYCFRDDVVFDPETNEPYQPQELKHILYAETETSP